MTSDEELRKLAERLETGDCEWRDYGAASSAILSLMEDRYAPGLEPVDNDIRRLTWREKAEREHGQFIRQKRMREEAEARATLAETRLERALEALRNLYEPLAHSFPSIGNIDPMKAARTVLSEMEREPTPSDPPASQSSALGDQESGR